MTTAGGGHARAHGTGRLRLASLSIVLGLLLCLLPPAAPVQAAVFNVNSLADPSPATGSCPATCTLRNAITAAAPGDTIQFTVTGTILLNSVLILTKHVTIQGPGAASLALDGQDTYGVILVQPGVQASLSGLTIQRGYSGIAGGVTNYSGNVSLLNVVVQNNRGGAYGAIVSLTGPLTVTNSTVTNNRSEGFTSESGGDGGGIGGVGSVISVSGSTISNNAAQPDIGYGGGVYANTGSVLIDRSAISGNTAVSGAGILVTNGSLAVTNSTISGNTASLSGGGVSASGSTASLTHVTLSGNAAPTGGGINAVATVTLRNSIVVNSPLGGNCTGAIVSNGNNLSDSAACFPGDATRGDVVTSTPLLGPLALNAPGATKTHALLYGSPAIDGVTFNPSECGSGIATDQRGMARPQAWAGPRCDIGAFELVANTPPSISSIGTQTVDEDGPQPAIIVTVGDAETPANLTVTGASSNQALIPNANISIGSSGFLRSLVVTPLPNQSGEATITLTANDGYTTATTAFLYRVTPVNDLPVAVNDTYTTNAGETLNATVGSGVLANDSDVDGPSLTAQLVQKPANGSIVLLPNGAFTYQPNAAFSGTDSFTYRAFDGVAPSTNTATVTITVTPTACAPRPVVKSQLAAGGGKLQVHVESTPLDGRPAGPIRKLQFGEIKNAKVVVGGKTMASGQEYIVTGNVTALDFTLERIVAGQPTTVPLTVVDDCGAWKTLVGGGAGAGF